MNRPALRLAIGFALIFGCDEGRPDADVGMDAPDSPTDGSADVSSADVMLDTPFDVLQDTEVDATIESRAMVSIAFSGCTPDFSGDVVVVENGSSIAVSATQRGVLTGSVQLALQDERGPLELSTQHRIDSGAVINVVTSSTWTNISSDSPDPISGTLVVNTYDQSGGIVDLLFQGVVLQNPSTGTLCELNGSLTTSGLSF